MAVLERCLQRGDDNLEILSLEEQDSKLNFKFPAGFEFNVPDVGATDKVTGGVVDVYDDWHFEGAIEIDFVDNKGP